MHHPLFLCINVLDVKVHELVYVTLGGQEGKERERGTDMIHSVCVYGLILHGKKVQVYNLNDVSSMQAVDS